VKNSEDMFIRFDRMFERDRHRHTHRMTAKAAPDAWQKQFSMYKVEKCYISIIPNKVKVQQFRIILTRIRKLHKQYRKLTELYCEVLIT